MIEGVQTTTGLIATTLEQPRRESVAEQTGTDTPGATDTATLSARAERRNLATDPDAAVLTRQEADEALEFVRQALAGQDVASVHSGLCAERVMQLVGLSA